MRCSVETMQAQRLCVDIECMINEFSLEVSADMVVPLDRFINRLVLVWIAGLVGIAGMALISGVMFDNAVSRTEAYADVINLAGRQRTLSQQVVLYASLYVEAETDARRAPFRRQLRSAVDTMRLEFDALKSHVEDIPALGVLYFDGAAPVEAANNEYWNAADSLLALPEEELSPRNALYLRIVQNSPEILNYADQGVQAVKDDSVAAAAELSEINILRIFIILAMLGAQFFFAFRPAVRRLYNKADLLQREIAERLQAESELRASEQRFRLLIENAPVGIFQVNPRGVITWVNQQWEVITGIRRESASSTQWTDAIHPEQRVAVVAQVQEKIAAGGGFAIDFRLAKASKSAVMLHVTVTPLKASNGTVISYIGMLIDITERKRAFEQELRVESERQRVNILGQFIRDDFGAVGPVSVDQVLVGIIVIDERSHPCGTQGQPSQQDKHRDCEHLPGMTPACVRNPAQQDHRRTYRNT